MDYLAESAYRTEELQSLEPSHAVGQISTALELSLGQGRDCFLEMKKHASAELVFASYNKHRRDGMTAVQAKHALIVEQEKERRKLSDGAGNNSKDAHLSERTIERKIKNAL